MSDRDDELDDPALRQMRAVWLSMRDEEPPQRGLSALLAAARAQAEQMRPKPSLWSRFLAGMRRPPVLALATVVVLLGGAIALTTRSESLDVNDSNDRRMKAPAMPAPVQPPAEPPPTATEAQGDLEKSKEPPPLAQEAPEVPARSSKPARPPRERPPTVTAKPPARTPAAAPERGFGGDGVAGRIEPAPPPPPSPPPAKAGDKKAEGKLSIATDDDAAPRNEPAGAPVEETSANAEAPKQQAQQPSAVQLVQQCETAATRGDCAAVRVLAERIRKLDGAVYRDRVQKNAAIVRCLK